MTIQINKFAIYFTDMDDFGNDYEYRYANYEFDTLLDACLFIGKNAYKIEENEFAFKLEIRQIK